MDSNPFVWFGGGTSDSFPLKRTPTYPPASFPTTHSGCPTGNGQCYFYDTVTIQGWYPRDAALQAIDQACSDWSGQRIPVSDSSDDIKTLSTTKEITWNTTKWTIEMSVWQTLLITASGSAVDQKSCVAALGSAMDDCQTNTISKKIGGEHIISIPGVGSQQYIIHPGEGNPAPPSTSDDEPFDT
jgi:hypothetical protein